ncbi:hypothetical protein BKD26_05920 [Streptomyces sp. CB03238]|nr:hypothetical protein BKD26_05920 [Streptomyces sp. CB03238]
MAPFVQPSCSLDAQNQQVTQVIEAHAESLRRVRDRDPRGAAAAMRAHLEQTERDLRAALRLE